MVHVVKLPDVRADDCHHRAIYCLEGAFAIESRWLKLSPLSGVVFVALVLSTFFTGGSMPSDKASGAKIVQFYTHHKTGQQVTALLTIIAVAVGVFFFGTLRARLRQHPGNERYAAMMFGGAILFAAGGCISAGLSLTLADRPAHLDPGAAQTLNLLQTNFSFPFTLAGIAALLLTSAIAILRGTVLPKWVGWLSLVMGVVALTGPLGWFAFMAMGPWCLIVSTLLYRRGEQPSVVELPDLPSQSVVADKPVTTKVTR